jgi:hypothetical protein
MLGIDYAAKKPLTTKQIAREVKEKNISKDKRAYASYLKKKDKKLSAKKRH